MFSVDQMTVLDRRGIFSLAGRGSNSAPSTKTLEEEVGEERLVLSKLAEGSSLSLSMISPFFFFGISPLPDNCRPPFYDLLLFNSDGTIYRAFRG